MELRSRKLPRSTNINDNLFNRNKNNTPVKEDTYFSAMSQTPKQSPDQVNQLPDINSQSSSTDNSISHVSDSLFGADDILVPDTPSPVPSNSNSYLLHAATSNQHPDLRRHSYVKHDKTGLNPEGCRDTLMTLFEGLHHVLQCQQKLEDNFTRLTETIISRLPQPDHQNSQPRQQYDKLESIANYTPQNWQQQSHQCPSQASFIDRLEHSSNNTRRQQNPVYPTNTGYDSTYIPRREADNIHKHQQANGIYNDYQPSSDESSHPGNHLRRLPQRSTHPRSRHYPERQPQANAHGRFFDEPRQPMPYFYGKPDEWETYWMKFQVLSRKYSWDETTQIENLILGMRDDAATFVTGLTTEVRKDFYRFIVALKDRFSHRTPTRTHRAKLENIRKNSKESIQEYASRVQLTMSKAYQDIEGTSTYTDLAIEHLLKGLPDQQMAYNISVKSPKTISEAVDMIILHESCKDNSKNRTSVRRVMSPRKTTSTPQMRVQRDGTRTQVLRRLNRKKFVTEERLHQLKRDVLKLIDKPGNQINKQGRRNQREPVTCYSCGKSRHIATQCPEKRNNNLMRSKPEPRSKKQTLNFKGQSPEAESQSHQ